MVAQNDTVVNAKATTIAPKAGSAETGTLAGQEDV